MTEAQLKAQFSSERDNWETPQDFFEKYNSVYHFNLDAASSDENAKCEKHYTIADDGLHNTWGGVQRMVESTLWQRDWKVGTESVGRVSETRHSCCDVTACEDGHGMVSRLLQAWRNNLYPRTLEVRWKHQFSTIPVNGCCV